MSRPTSKQALREGNRPISGTGTTGSNITAVTDTNGNGMGMGMGMGGSGSMMTGGSSMGGSRPLTSATGSTSNFSFLPDLRPEYEIDATKLYRFLNQNQQRLTKVEDEFELLGGDGGVKKIIQNFKEELDKAIQFQPNTELNMKEMPESVLSGTARDYYQKMLTPKVAELRNMINSTNGSNSNNNVSMDSKMEGTLLLLQSMGGNISKLEQELDNDKKLLIVRYAAATELMKLEIRNMEKKIDLKPSRVDMKNLMSYCTDKVKGASDELYEAIEEGKREIIIEVNDDLVKLQHDMTDFRFRVKQNVDNLDRTIHDDVNRRLNDMEKKMGQLFGIEANGDGDESSLEVSIHGGIDWKKELDSMKFEIQKNNKIYEDKISHLEQELKLTKFELMEKMQERDEYTETKIEKFVKNEILTLDERLSDDIQEIASEMGEHADGGQFGRTMRGRSISNNKKGENTSDEKFESLDEKFQTIDNTLAALNKEVKDSGETLKQEFDHRILELVKETQDDIALFKKDVATKREAFAEVTEENFEKVNQSIKGQGEAVDDCKQLVSTSLKNLSERVTDMIDKEKIGNQKLKEIVMNKIADAGGQLKRMDTDIKNLETNMMDEMHKKETETEGKFRVCRDIIENISDQVLKLAFTLLPDDFTEKIKHTQYTFSDITHGVQLVRLDYEEKFGRLLACDLRNVTLLRTLENIVKGLATKDNIELKMEAKIKSHLTGMIDKCCLFESQIVPGEDMKLTKEFQIYISTACYSISKVLCAKVDFEVIRQIMVHETPEEEDWDHMLFVNRHSLMFKFLDNVKEGAGKIHPTESPFVLEYRAFFMIKLEYALKLAVSRLEKMKPGQSVLSRVKMENRLVCAACDRGFHENPGPGDTRAATVDDMPHGFSGQKLSLQRKVDKLEDDKNRYLKAKTSQGKRMSLKKDRAISRGGKGGTTMKPDNNGAYIYRGGFKFPKTSLTSAAAVADMIGANDNERNELAGSSSFLPNVGNFDMNSVANIQGESDTLALPPPVGSNNNRKKKNISFEIPPPPETLPNL